MDIENTLSIYHRVIDMLQTDDLVMGINGKDYPIADLTHDIILSNPTKISYLYRESDPNAKIYSSRFIDIIIVMSIDRSNETVSFIKSDDGVVNFIYDTINWAVTSGYSTAVSDMSMRRQGRKRQIIRS